MKKICVVTSTRAEYGLLKNTIDRIVNDSELELCLFVTVTHLLESHGQTISEIENDGYPIEEEIHIFNENDSTVEIALCMGKAYELFAKAFDKHKPDILVVLGDRLELLPICSVALLFGIPIAHLCGGEITEGAIDDSVRHAITKLSNLHFCGCEEYRNRIIRMGENPQNVFNVGSPGVENVLSTKLLSIDTVLREIGVTNGDYVLATFHPETVNKGLAANQISEVMKAVLHFKDIDFIFTKANADDEGFIINRILEEYDSRYDNIHVYSSLGRVRYLSLMKGAKVVLGNSSSGIVEAPCFKVPTVNVGERQRGRLRTTSIIDCACKENDIVEAINTVLSGEFVDAAKSAINQFGEGNTSRLVVQEIKNSLLKGNISKKIFYDGFE